MFLNNIVYNIVDKNMVNIDFNTFITIYEYVYLTFKVIRI